MIEALCRTVLSSQGSVSLETEGATPVMRHRVTVPEVSVVEVAYHLRLAAPLTGTESTFELSATYRVAFMDGEAADPVLAQGTTWPYFRQDAEQELQQCGLAGPVLPVLNPVAPPPAPTHPSQ